MLLTSLVRADAQRLLTFDFHALIEQQLHRLGHAVKAMFREQLDDFTRYGRMSLVGHCWSP